MDQAPKNESLLSTEELARYLEIKLKTLYAKAESGEIPHYKIGRLVRFRMSDVEIWLEKNRKSQRARRILRAGSGSIDRLVKKAIDETRRAEYTSPHGKPDQIKGLGKEV